MQNYCRLPAASYGDSQCNEVLFLYRSLDPAALLQGIRSLSIYLYFKETDAKSHILPELET